MPANARGYARGLAGRSGRRAPEKARVACPANFYRCRQVSYCVIAVRYTCKVMSCDYILSVCYLNGYGRLAWANAEVDSVFEDRES